MALPTRTLSALLMLAMAIGAAVPGQVAGAGVSAFRPRRALAQGNPIDYTDEYTTQVCSLEDESSEPAVPQELNCDKVAGGMFSSDRAACYKPCSSYNTAQTAYKTLPGQDVSLCFPACANTPDVFQVSVTQQAVTCARCPSNKPVYDAKTKKCYPTCPTGYVAPTGSPNYCSLKCPSQYPIEKDLKLCSTKAGKTWNRQPKSATGLPATLTSTSVKDRDTDTVPRTCPDSAEQLDAPLPDSASSENGGMCFKSCPEGSYLKVENDANGDPYAATCATGGSCPDGYKKCSSYCFDDTMDDAFGAWDYTTCAASFGLFACIRTCSSIDFNVLALRRIGA